MRKLLLTLGLSLGLATSVYANSFTGRFVLENRNDPVIMSYLNGVAQALTFANAKRDVDGYPMMFCTRSISLTGELAAEAIRIAADVHGDDGHPAVLVMYGFEEMFPCP
jgi:hypothetical protein